MATGAAEKSESRERTAVKGLPGGCKFMSSSPAPIRTYFSCPFYPIRTEHKVSDTEGTLQKKMKRKDKRRKEKKRNAHTHTQQS